MLIKKKLVFKLVVLSSLATIAACNKANFGGQAGRNAKGAVVPAQGLKNPKNPALDLSELEINQPIKDTGGPIGSQGEELAQTIELGCENSSGVIVDVIDPTPGKPGDEPTPFDPPGTTPSDPEGPFDGPLYELVGKPDPVDLGPDGKVIGGKPNPGKPDGKPLPPITLPKPGKVVTTVKGEFCPEAKNSLTVLFVVDFSGSMGRHVPIGAKTEIPGHDPQINGTCGRLRAAQAIVDRILSEKSPADEVLVGMIPFAGGIVGTHVMQITEIEDFINQMTKDTFCQYVVQGPSFGYDPINPGGMPGQGMVNSSTNYRAAFTAAESLLSRVYGRKEVYFISDGEPTSGGFDPIQAGIVAGASLRRNVNNLQLNGLLLGHDAPNARQVLEAVAGSPDRVREADEADQLADQIMQFPVASIDEGTGEATLTVAPYPTEGLGLQFLGKHPQKPGVWLYETQPFVLLGIPGQTVVNRVDVTALGQDGSTHAAVVEIHYKIR